METGLSVQLISWPLKRLHWAFCIGDLKKGAMSARQCGIVLITKPLPSTSSNSTSDARGGNSKLSVSYVKKEKHDILKTFSII